MLRSVDAPSRRPCRTPERNDELASSADGPQRLTQTSCLVVVAGDTVSMCRTRCYRVVFHLAGSAWIYQSAILVLAVVAAVIVSGVVSCTNDSVNPEKEKGSKTKNVDPCPACGMG